jgi:hypothetical protein
VVKRASFVIVFVAVIDPSLLVQASLLVHTSLLVPVSIPVEVPVTTAVVLIIGLSSTMFLNIILVVFQRICIRSGSSWSVWVAHGAFLSPLDPS